MSAMQRNSILFTTLIIPGLIVVGTSIYWFNLDYATLGKAEIYAEKLVKNQQINDRQINYAYHVALRHRINVFADGTWGLLGGIITAIGIFGIVQQPNKSS
jgi:hypothetical protein